jgi:TPR repeat protein
MKIKKLDFSLVFLLVSLLEGEVGAGYYPGRTIDKEEEKETTPISTILHERIEKEDDDDEILDEKEIDFFHQRRLEFLDQMGFEYFEKNKYSEAYMCFRILANEGLAEAQYNVGLMHRYGWGKKINTKKAQKWLVKASEQKVASANFDLGVIYYEEGYLSLALKYFKRAALHGNRYAQSNLGVLYKNYFENYKEAIKWFLEASDLSNAQYNIGIMYRDGLAFPQNSDKALVWLTKAASQGHTDAQKAIKTMIEGDER